jgi:hypothetical protein
VTGAIGGATVTAACRRNTAVAALTVPDVTTVIATEIVRRIAKRTVRRIRTPTRTRRRRKIRMVRA